eukprot:scaffold187460_cov36-Cyclotella_meneghiniana.AAC.1
MSQAAAIDTLVSVGGRISYSCKIIVEDVYAGLFNDFVQDALLQYSRVTLPPDTSSADGVNAYTRYVLEWIVALRKLLTNGVEMIGQDDKAKIPVGEGVPISTGVRPNNRSSIVDVNEVNSPNLQACDHDFHVGNLTLSATLRCNIPKEIGGSFFIGDPKEEGFGQVFYTLRDSVFDPSRVFDHTSQLIYSLEKENLNPFVLVLQTDGGPDHSIKFLNTKMALLALFLKMNLDHLLVLRGAPNGSAYNKIERAMSPANAALSNFI